jgi:hypothetical protein
VVKVQPNQAVELGLHQPVQLLGEPLRCLILHPEADGAVRAAR